MRFNLMRAIITVSVLLWVSPVLAQAPLWPGRDRGEPETPEVTQIQAAGADCTIDAGFAASCQLAKGASTLDLAALVQGLSGVGVTAQTIFWVQAWGGNGSDGNVCCTRGGRGGRSGRSGYAQTTTTLSAYHDAFDTTHLYYYLGLSGTFAADAGGDGGTAM
jgi:hypothetical protein